MNNLTIPPSPNWYSTSILACSSDNTLIYGTRHDIVVVNPTTDEKPADVKIIPYAHRQKIVSVVVNKKWGSPYKHCVTTAEDKVVCLWDISQYNLKGSHTNHVTHDEKVVAASFAGEQKVVSVSENGRIVIWQFNTKEEAVINDLLGPKNIVTCLSVCPHVTWLAGFGLKNGLLVIADLKKSGKVLYRLRGHDRPIVSLSWCPVAVNVFPVYPRNRVRNESISEKAAGDALPSSPDGKETPVFQNKEPDIQEAVPKNTESSKDSEAKSDETAGTAVTAENDDRQMNSSVSSLQEDGKDIEGAVGADESLQSEKSMESIDNEEAHDSDAKENPDASLKSDDETANKCVILEPVQETARKEFLLASSGKEGNVYIWRAGTDGRMQTFFSATNSSRKARNKGSDAMWISLNWISPNWLLTSTPDGGLLRWTLPKPLDRDTKPVVIHNDHSGILFSIAGPTRYYTGNKWDNDEELSVWTTSYDRLLLNTGLNAQRKNLARYPTFGGSVCAVVASHITPTRLALGLSDGTIRVWELAHPHTVRFDMTRFCQRINGKVSILAWHPSKEFLLAFGTSEGRIGILDTSNPSKPPKTYAHHFRAAVHNLEWAVLGENGLENPKMYLVSETKLFVFDEKTIEEPNVVSMPEKLYVYNFSWKPDYSKLLVSTKTGELLIYSPEHELLHTRYLHQRGFSHIAWHPYGRPGNIDDDNSAVCWFAATVINDYNVYIYDFTKLCEDDGWTPQASLVLDGHFETVTCLAWDCLQGNKIVAGSESGVAQVWDTLTGKLIVSYIEPHFESIMTVMWSPLDENYVISTSKNASLTIWNILEHPPVDKEELTNKRKKYISSVKGKLHIVLPKLDKPNLEPTKPKKQSKNFLLPLHSLGQNNVKKNCSNLRRLLKWCEEKRNDPKVPLPPDSEESKIDFLQLFGTREQMHNVLEKNEEAHYKKRRPHLQVVSSLFKGDIGEYIKQAIEEKSVTAQMVSVAPMVSQKVWQEACLTYAEQLNESPDSDPVDTAMYYLACHKVQEAIACLCNNDLYKEALALTKCRYLENDPMVLEITQRWAKYAFLQGDFETSAACYIVLGEYEEASKVLFRRSDETLAVAVEVAELSGNKALAKAVKSRYVLFKPSLNENREFFPKFAAIMEKKSTSSQHPDAQDETTQIGDAQSDNKCSAEEEKSTDGTAVQAARDVPENGQIPGDDRKICDEDQDTSETKDGKDSGPPQNSKTNNDKGGQDNEKRIQKEADDSSGIESA